MWVLFTLLLLVTCLIPNSVSPPSLDHVGPSWRSFIVVWMIRTIAPSRYCNESMHMAHWCHKEATCCSIKGLRIFPLRCSFRRKLSGITYQSNFESNLTTVFKNLWKHSWVYQSENSLKRLGIYITKIFG